jgi:hypothetical protein
MRIVELARRSFIPVALAALTVLAVEQERDGAGLRPPREPGFSANARRANQKRLADWQARHRQRRK